MASSFTVVVLVLVVDGGGAVAVVAVVDNGDAVVDVDDAVDVPSLGWGCAVLCCWRRPVVTMC